MKLSFFASSLKNVCGFSSHGGCEKDHFVAMNNVRPVAEHNGSEGEAAEHFMSPISSVIHVKLENRGLRALKCQTVQLNSGGI